jgi:hypothetical protein
VCDFEDDDETLFFDVEDDDSHYPFEKSCLQNLATLARQMSSGDGSEATGLVIASLFPSTEYPRFLRA